MSNSSNDSQNGVDLSALSFGPAWAKDKAPKKDFKKYEGKDNSPRERKGKNFQRPGNKGPRDNRRDNNRGPRRGNDGRDFRTDRPKFQPAEAPEGFTGEIMPVEEGLDRLGKQILQTSRTYSVFELARLVLQSRERFNVGIKAPKGTKLFRNTISFATYLTKEEALENFWQSENVSKFYQEVKKEVEAPTGNYPSVAKCSKSGVFLGPPNHHNYQIKLRALHRERFASLPLEVFQRQIDVLKDEEDINAWIESEKFQTFHLPVSYETPAHTPAAKDDTAKDSAEPQEETAEQTPEVDDALLIKSRAELERHFSENHFDKVFKQVQISWVPSTIPGKELSPGLLTLLKLTIAEERKYPGKLASLMCRQLSGRNVAVFKLKKKLKAGPCRPHAIPALETLSDRPKSLLAWAIKNDGKGVDQLWQDILPENVSEEDKAEWFKDFKWLLSQGFVLLEENGVVFYSRKEEAKPATPKAKVEEQSAPTSEIAPKPIEEPKVEETLPEAPPTIEQ